MQVTATQAKNRFGAICAHAKTEPVFIEKDGRIDSVILSAKQYSELCAAGRTEMLAQRKAEFEHAHGAWLAEQNQRFDAHGRAVGSNDDRRQRPAAAAVPGHHLKRQATDAGAL